MLDRGHADAKLKKNHEVSTPPGLRTSIHRSPRRFCAVVTESAAEMGENARPMSRPIDRVSPIQPGVSLSFDDVLLLPGHSSVLPSGVRCFDKAIATKLRFR